MANRPFRTRESIVAEQVTRRMVLEYLRDRGFSIDADRRVRNGQTIEAVTPHGEAISMRVKLCWRRGSDGRDREGLASYSAAQLMAPVEDDDWIGSIERKMGRESSKGVTHMLFVQRDGQSITDGALVPLEVVPEVWVRQRDISTRLIDEGRLGGRKKNHTMNGASPTIWLRDERGGQQVAAALWNHPDVADLSGFRSGAPASLLPEEVSDPGEYQEGTCRRIAVNAYERDSRARWKCIEHYGTQCFVCGFDFGAVYGPEAEGLIHVHHLRPLATIGETYSVDPIADLRPLCPNCHAVVHLNGGCRTPDDVRAMLDGAR